MKELIKAVEMMKMECQQVFNLAQRSPTYAYVHTYFDTIKYCQYALVLLLNLNVMMISYVPAHSSKYRDDKSTARSTLCAGIAPLCSPSTCFFLLRAFDLRLKGTATITRAASPWIRATTPPSTWQRGGRRWTRASSTPSPSRG